MKKFLVSLAVVAFSASSAQAEEASPDWFGKVGWLHIAPNDSSTAISGPGLPAGTAVSIQDADTLGLSIGRRFGDHFAVELIVDVPPKLKTDAAGSINGLGTVATSRPATPVVMAQYYFGRRDAPIRPYLGAGVVYSIFRHAGATPALSAALGGPTSVSIDDSFGPAVQAGVDVRLNSRFFLNATVAYLGIETRATLATPAVGTVRTVDVKINPIATLVGVGYRF